MSKKAQAGINILAMYLSNPYLLLSYNKSKTDSGPAISRIYQSGIIKTGCRLQENFQKQWSDLTARVKLWKSDLGYRS